MGFLPRVEAELQRKLTPLLILLVLRGQERFEKIQV